MEALQEAVVVLDWDRHVLDANRSIARLFDRSPESRLSNSRAEVYGADTAKQDPTDEARREANRRLILSFCR